MYALYLALLCLALYTHCEATLDNIKSVSEEIQKLKEGNRKLNRKVLQLQEEINTIECKACNIPIGFAVYYSRGLQLVETGHRVEYDTILTDAGATYNRDNYMYQCPVSGYYHFHFSMYSDIMHNQELCAAAIFLDGNRIVGQRMFKQGPEDVSNTASNSVYMLCQAGQTVWVEVTDNGQISGDRNNTLTTFSGFLLNQIF